MRAAALADARGGEGEEEDDDGDEEREYGEAGGVGDLQGGLAVGEDDGAVADEVLPGGLGRLGDGIVGREGVPCTRLRRRPW